MRSMKILLYKLSSSIPGPVFCFKCSLLEHLVRFLSLARKIQTLLQLKRPFPGQILLFGTKDLTKNVLFLFVVLLLEKLLKFLFINFVTEKKLVLKVFYDLYLDNSSIGYWPPIPWNWFFLTIICPATNI